MRGTKYGTVSPEQLAAAELVWRGCISLDAPAPGATDENARTLVDVVEGGRLEVEQLGQIEAVTAAWETMEAVDPDAVALLQLRHGDGAGLQELGRLEGTNGQKINRRLVAVRHRIRSLPEVQMALAG